MTVTNGIPPISDYAHWNEDAERIWYEENKYDMLHPEVFDDYRESMYDDWYPDDHYMDPDKCHDLNGHCANQDHGIRMLFGPFGEVKLTAYRYCSDCGIDLFCDWTPNGYRVIEDSMIDSVEMLTVLGRKHYLQDQFAFPVYERIEA